MQAMHFCEECGAANADDAAICFACHKSFATPSSSASPSVAFTEVPVGNGAVALTLAEPATPAVSGPLPPGYLLAQRYEIIKQIGQGGFGTVYKAKDEQQRNKLVAVKQINLEQLTARNKKQVTDSYQREITLHSGLKHKHLPYVYEHFTDPQNWYLVMDYIPGETLTDYLKHKRDGKLRLREVLDIGIQLCDVLEYLHMQQKIIFRDVKPDNIIRIRGGRLYLIDFGIARRYQEGKNKDTVPLGSPGYAAPEQYGLSQTTARTDVYGLGVTLQTLLTGESVSNDTQPGITGALGSSAPKALQDLLDQMLSWEPGNRPESMEIVKQRLQSIRIALPKTIGEKLLDVLRGTLLGAFIGLLYVVAAFSGISRLLHVPALWLAGGVVLLELLVGVGLLSFRRSRFYGIGIIIAIVLLSVVLALYHTRLF